MAGRVTIDQFKSQLGRPSLTSKYYVEIPLPSSKTSGQGDAPFRNFAKARGLDVTSDVQRNINLYCSEASLPGSSLALIDVASDRTGVTERHAHRRVFDDRIDLTFYVDGDNYTVIKYFETWLDFISGASTSDQNKQVDETYHYRMNYVDDYSCSGMNITKFESDSFKNISPTGGSLVYTFVKAFPIAINSMPVSYDSSQLLKCTVSMTYLRYVIKRTVAQTPPGEKTPIPQPKDGSSAAERFFNDNRTSLLNDKNGSRFNFDATKFGGGRPVSPNLNSNIG